MPPLYYFLLSLPYLSLLVSSASNPTSFCKCTCGSNSTIIPLDAPSSSSSSSSTSFLLTRSPLQQLPQLLRPREDDAANPKPDKDKDNGKSDERKEYRKKTCNDCNKQYCLSQHLHICEGKAAEEVFTTCFRTFCPFPSLLQRGRG
ncbi:MAG: hypothetical protein LQ338_006736 [Usnochroma carphineum]|nr:MAG: hypothetical protein LQ338_006736 [Usnochroma carphineum]